MNRNPASSAYLKVIYTALNMVRLGSYCVRGIIESVDSICRNVVDTIGWLHSEPLIATLYLLLGIPITIIMSN